MSKTKPEARFHSKLFDKLDDYVNNNDTPFNEVSIEKRTKEGTYADIIVKGNLTADFVIEVKRDDKYLLNSKYIKQARDYAKNENCEYFALCTSDDFFLFDYTEDVYDISDLSWYWLDLSDSDNHHKTMNGVIPTILHSVEFLYENERIPDQNKKVEVTGLLKPFFNSMWKINKDLIEKHYNKNIGFANKVDKWVQQNDYGNLNQNEIYDRIAKQYSYIIVNRILFYDVLRRRLDQNETILNEIHDVSYAAIFDNMDRQFSRVVDNIDYEPIFKEDSELFSSIPKNNKSAQKLIKEFISNIETSEFVDFDSDLIGDIYEELIPRKERKKLGQFYTPPKVAETIVRWTLSGFDETPSIMDPATGSGTFLVESYNVLKELYNSSHEQIIKNTDFIDVNKFPLHLATLNIARQDLSNPTDFINSHHKSFFSVDKEEIGKIDCVVGNPPYIGYQELYPSTEHFREHLKDYNPNGNKRPIYYNGTKKLSKQTDAYVYFITYAIQFLKEGGKLGFIIPTKWLDTKYGRDLQQFLMDNTKINSIISFDSRVFDDALVDTCVLLLEKCQNEDKNNKVDFIRIKDEMAPKDVINNIDNNIEPNKKSIKVKDNKSIRLVTMNQSYLQSKAPGKLGKYISSVSADIIELIDENEKMINCNSLADVSRGVITGADKFFYLSEDKAKKYNIDNKFLKKIIKSNKYIDGHIADNKNSDYKYIFYLSDYIDSHDKKFKSSKDVKECLKKENYMGALRYIEKGESDDYNNNSKCKKRDIWFDIGKIRIPDMIFPISFNEEVYPILNKDNFVIHQRLYSVAAKNDVDPDALSAVMNSNLFKITCEIYGRKQGGGALEVMVYELKESPIPDIRKFSSDSINKLKKYGKEIKEGKDRSYEIDTIIIKELDSDIKPDVLESTRNELVKNRVESTSNTESLITDSTSYSESELEKWVKKNKIEENTDSKTKPKLEDFLS